MIPKEILKKVRHIEIRTKHKVNDVFAGQYHSAFKGQGMEFEEVREYIPGDDIRSIDWNVTARMNAPFIKKFREERELTVFLVVDISASHLFGSSKSFKRDVSAELAAVLAFAAIKNNDRVGLILHSGEVECYVPPEKGLRHVLRVVSDVLHFQPKRKDTALVPAIEFLNRITTRKCVVFFIGDFIIPEDYVRPLSVTARRHDVISLRIADRREEEWPRAGLIEWEDAESGRRVLVDSSDARTRKRLASIQAARREKFENQMARIGIDTIEISASEPYEREFMKFFKRRAARL